MCMSEQVAVVTSSTDHYYGEEMSDKEQKCRTAWTQFYMHMHKIYYAMYCTRKLQYTHMGTTVMQILYTLVLPAFGFCHS